MTGSLRKPGKHLFCDSVGNLETGAEVDLFVSTNAGCWQNKGEEVSVPQILVHCGRGPGYRFVYAVGEA